MKKLNIKRLLVIVLAALMIFSQGPLGIALAQEIPTPPPIPTAPPAPTSPPAPTAPPISATPSDPIPTPPPIPTAPPAPTSPPAPTAPAAPNTINDPTPTPANSSDTNIVGGGGQTENGNSGTDPSITTGNANNVGNISTLGSSNLSVTPDEAGGSATVINSGNGAGSSNSGSATIVDNNGTTQTNSATVTNNLTQTTLTGENSSSFNTGGNSSITTGNANTSGTVITSVNTNLSGVAVAEFNVSDNQTGDLLLNLAAGCISGCGVLNGTSVANTDNGAGSTNSAGVTNTTNNSTTQTNNANVTSNLDLTSISGNNAASFNTGGDSTITTGDANVSANALTFANNNIAGGVVYGIVNIYGTLTGNIVLSQDQFNNICGNCLAGNANVTNTGNGAGSSNDATFSQNSNDSQNQSNLANIDNNLILNAQTGANDASLNTSGNSGIKTGSSNVTANVLNIVNSNVSGAPMWLVIVNRAGQWIGQIMGAPGSDMYGSAGTEFVVNPDGSISVTNGNNGADSTNNANVTETNNNTTTQTNNAQITNNLNLNAKTGGNKSSFNTNGDSSITTGDANIIANLVNFVNNNISGGGKLVVTVVNVFGKWFGDFVGPGQTARTPDTGNSDPVASSNNGSGSNSGGSNGGSNSGNSGSGNSTTIITGSTIKPKVLSANTYSVGNEIAYAGTDNLGGTSTTEPKGTLNINLTWGIPVILLGTIWFIFKRKFAH